jgi:penicillin-binding protein 1C
VRQALGNSLNIPAVRVLEQVGVANFLQRLHQLGFRHLNRSPEYYGLGLTLGSGEVSLWELAQAYLLIAQQGRLIPLQMQKITYPQTQVLPVTIGNPAIWALMTDMLSDPFARARAFGVDSVLRLPFATAVKTGTSSDYRDTWTIGFSHDYTVATWVGNFNGEPMRNVSGVTGAAPLWNRIMLHLHQNQEPADFTPPEGMVQRPICAISGYKPNPGCPAVVQEYLEISDLATYEQQPDPIVQSVRSESGKPQYRLNLPSEYDSWLASQPELLAMSNVSQSETATLRIAFPRNGDYFLASAPGAIDQKLEFKLTHPPSQPVTWKLNGQLLAQGSEQSLFWPLQPGQWHLEMQTNGQQDQVDFEVQPATSTPSRRGFTVVN